jgi:hypothetical protein
MKLKTYGSITDIKIMVNKFEGILLLAKVNAPAARFPFTSLIFIVFKLDIIIYFSGINYG